MNFIASLEPHVVMYILSSISEGLTALGKARPRGAPFWFVPLPLLLHACVCRHHGVHWLLLQSGPHRHLPVQAAVPLHQEEARCHGNRRPLPPHHAAAPGDDPAGQLSPESHLPFAPHPPHGVQAVVLLQMLSTVLNIIIFEDCRNQWSMSRPLLGLILLNEKVSWQQAPPPNTRSCVR